MKNDINDIIYEAYEQKGDIGYEEWRYNDDKSKARRSKAYREAMEAISKELKGQYDDFFVLYLYSDDKTRKTLDSKVKTFPVLVFDYVEATQRLFNEHRLREMRNNREILNDKNLEQNFHRVEKEVLVNCILEFRKPEILQNKKNELIDELNEKQGFFSKMIESIFGPSINKQNKILEIKRIATKEELEKFKLKHAKKAPIAEIERNINGGFLKFQKSEIQNKKNELIYELNEKQGFFSKMIESIFGPSNDKHIAILDIQNIETEKDLEKFKLEQAKKALIAEIERSINGGFWQTLKHLMVGGVSEETKEQISAVQKISTMKEFEKYKRKYDKQSLGLREGGLSTFDNRKISSEGRNERTKQQELEMALLPKDPLSQQKIIGQ